MLCYTMLDLWLDVVIGVGGWWFWFNGVGEIGCLLTDGMVFTRTKRVVCAILSLRLDILKEAGGCQSRFNAVAGWSRSDAHPLMESSVKLTERRLAQSECLGEQWQALFLVLI